MELDNSLRLFQKESDVIHPNLIGTAAENAISKKDSKLSKIGSIVSQKGSTISQRMSKISHRDPKVSDPDDIQSEFSVFLDAKVPESKFKTPLNEPSDKTTKNPGLAIFNEFDETRSDHSTDNKILK